MRIDLRDYYIPTPKQHEFHIHPARWRLYGGSMGGGKTYAVVAEALKLSIKYPGNRGAFIRKTLRNLRQTTLITFLRICPPELIESFNKSEMEITLINGSTILFIEGDVGKDPNLNKLKGLEVGWFCIEEADEVHEKVFRIMTTRLRWKLPSGVYPRRVGFLTCNPEDSWLKSRFVDVQLPHHAFIPALPRDNPKLPKSYMADMMAILTPEEIERYIRGSWQVKDSPDQLIHYKWVKNAERLEDLDILDLVGTQGMGVDVARFGDDDSVISYTLREGEDMIHLLSQEAVHGWDVRQLSDLVGTRITERGIRPDQVGVDGVGLGAGVVDNLRGSGWKVKDFQAGGSPQPTKSKVKFKNMRAQGYWGLREMFRDGTITIPKHQRLREDLLAHRYKLSSERMVTILSKEEMKKATGVSPDYSDSLMMATSTNLVSGGKISRARVW